MSNSKYTSLLRFPFLMGIKSAVKQTAENILFFVLLLITGSLSSLAQTDGWTQKSDFGGTARLGAAGFSIGSKGYIGTGYKGLNGRESKDFWEYDPGSNTWTQKADFGGTEREGAVGFSIGSKGYLGIGYNDHGYYYKDFWEYDPVSNAWTQKADFGGYARAYAVGFSIGNKGYLGTGMINIQPLAAKDFWEYDPTQNTWTQKADFAGNGRFWSVGFSIGTKGYLGTGYYFDGLNADIYKDFWQYDPSTNAWTQKADFAGASRCSALGFSIGGKGYLGTGLNNGTYYIDFWEYDPATNSWKRKTDFEGQSRAFSTGFSIGNKGYLGIGSNSGAYYKDFWEYTPSDVMPLQLISFTAALQKANAVLKWETANEVNTAHFNIQRSFNGSNFTNIAKQKAAGNGIKQEYIYSDNNVTALQQSTLFYCLQMVDKDGSFTYSNIVQVKVNNSNSVQFSISPNPAKDKLQISISCAENTTMSIRIVDMQGRQVYTNNLTAVAGTVHKDIDISKMAKGIYSIQLINYKGTTKSSFVKE